MTTQAVARRTSTYDITRWAKQGVIGGVLTGIAFVMFEMMMAVMLMGSEAFFMPLRMIGAMVLGQRALDPGTSLLLAGGVGAAVHMMLSAAFGAMVAVAAALVPRLRGTMAALLFWASVAGLALWVVNFHVIAPIAGWTWFPDGTDPVVQFVAHTLVFGAMLGLYLDRSARRQGTDGGR